MTSSAIPRLIDLRSDTVTIPTESMRKAMAQAVVGDDVYGEDSTVNQLQEYVAGLAGKEAALFVPTGVMSNQLCLKSLTKPGDEVILGANSHIFNYETGAPALLSGIQLHTIPDWAGRPSIQDIDEAVREGAYYLPRTAVIALEQTHNRAGGTVIPLSEMRAITQYAKDRGISAHLDGARIWNASVATGITVGQYAEGFDTVSVCFSKGLGAPVGSVLCGTKQAVTIAHKFRKIWGGGWRQAGILAAGCLHALQYHLPRLGEDHEKAQLFSQYICQDHGVLIPNPAQTNIVVFSVSDVDAMALTRMCVGRGVLISSAFKGKLRAVFHQDVSLEEVRWAAEVVLESIAGIRGGQS